MCYVQHFKTIEQMCNKLWAHEISRHLSLRYVSDRYPILHKDPDCDPEPHKKLPIITCSKYDLSWFHENLLYRSIRTETTHNISCDDI